MESLIMNKVFSYLEIIGILSYFRGVEKDELNELPLKTRWYLKKNLDILKKHAKTFEEFRDTQAEDLEKKWSTEEFAIKIEEQKKREDGTLVYDPKGNPVYDEKWQVKEEYKESYQEELAAINNKLVEIAKEKIYVAVSVINLDEFVENLPDDSKLTFDTIDMLTFMDTTTNVYNG
jgi:hypothetical protein